MFSCVSAWSAPLFWRYDHASNSRNPSRHLRRTYLAGNNPVIDAGRKLLHEAISKEYLNEPYVNVDKKHRGSALSYDLYDVSRNEILIQRRYTVCTKYGNSPTKNYFVIRRHGRTIQVLRVTDDAKPL